MIRLLKEGLRMRPTATRTTLLTIVLATAAGAHAAEIQALSGTFQEEVQSILPGADGKLSLKTPDRQLDLGTVKVVRFQESSSAQTLRGLKVLLTNGDSLRGEILAPPEDHDGESIALRSRALGNLNVPLGLTRALIPETTPESERKLEAKLDDQEASDWIMIRDGGLSTGTILEISDTGVVIEDERVGSQLTFAYTEMDIAVLALLDEPPATPSALHVVVRLVDGSVLTGVLDRLEKDAIYLRHPLAGKDKLLSIPVSRAAELAIENGSFVYLSDLDPVQVEQRFPPGWTFEVERWGWKRDASVDGGPLRLGGRTYEKGLGVHSYCKLSFPLGGNFKEFRAVVGLDDETRWRGGDVPNLGAVVFRVEVDGKPAKSLPEGLVRRKGEDPQEIKVDVTGASTITLIADFDPISLHILGRADWADAHLIKP